MKKLIDALFEVDFQGDLALVDDPDVWICEKYFLRLINMDHANRDDVFRVVVTDTPMECSIPLVLDEDYDVAKLGYSNCHMDTKHCDNMWFTPYITLIFDTARFLENKGLVPDTEYFITITKVE